MSGQEELKRRYGGRRVLVLGAGGFLGRWLCRGLSLVEASVVSTFRPGGRSPTVPGARRLFDVRDGDDSLMSLMDEAAPDIIFNLVSYGVRPSERDAATSHAINCDFPLKLAKILVKRPKTTLFFHLGSALEYGPVGGFLSPEGPHQPHTLYGRHKLLCTRALSPLIAANKLAGAVVRPFTVYGPEDHSHKLFPSLLAASSGQRPIALSEGNQQRDFVFMGDVIRGLLALGVSEKRGPPVINFASGRFVSVKSFIQEVAAQVSMDDTRLGFGQRPSRQDEMPAEGIDRQGVKQHLGAFNWRSVKAGIAWTLKLERGGAAGWMSDPGWVFAPVGGMP